MLIGRSKTIRSSEFHKKKQQQKYVRVGIITAAVLFAIGVPVLISRIERIRITSVVITGNEVTEAIDINKRVSEHLAGAYAFVIPKSNAFLYERAEIESTLMTEIPRIKTVDLSVSNLNTLHVAVEERVPEALYCKDISLFSAPSECFFLDSKGFIFSEAPSFSGDVYFMYSSNPLIEFPLGKQYLPEDVFASLSALIETLRERNIPVTALAATEDEFQLYVSEGGMIMWNAEERISHVLSNIESFLGSEIATSEPDFFSNILYIDLRFGNKVFYKFKGDI